MERLNYLIKKRESYLSYFYKAVKKLTSLNDRIVREQENLERGNVREEETIKEAQSKIKDGKKGITFLGEQTKINEAQIAKIKAIVEPTLPLKKEK